VAYWAVSRLALNHERLALHCLTLAGFTTYLPRCASGGCLTGVGSNGDRLSFLDTALPGSSCSGVPRAGRRERLE
jgi:hypothetical protein